MVKFIGKTNIHCFGILYRARNINKTNRQKRIGLSYPIHNLIQKWKNTVYCGVLFWNLLSFGFGYETNIAGIGAPPNFHVMASEVLAHTPRQHPIACPSLTSIKTTLLKSQRYDSLLAVKRWPRVQVPGSCLYPGASGHALFLKRP